MEQSAEDRRRFHALCQWLEESSVTVNGRCLTLEQVLGKATEMVLADQIGAWHLLEMVQIASTAIVAQNTGDMGKSGVLTLEVVNTLSSTEPESDRGSWERLSFSGASCVSMWRPRLWKEEQETVQNSLLKQRAVMILGSDSACPNPLLRLEMLRFIAMLDLPDLLDQSLGYNVATGLINISLHIKASHLVRRGRPGILYSLKRVLQNIQITGFPRLSVLRSCIQVRQLEIGQSERSLAYLVFLLGRTAKRVERLHLRGYLTAKATVDKFSDIIQTLHVLVAIPPCQQLYDELGMAQIAADTIDTTCLCLLKTPDVPEASQVFCKLLNEVNSFFQDVAEFQVTGALLKELRRHHGSCLSSITDRMRRLGCPASHVPHPAEEATQGCPERFLDAMTGLLMEEPVLLLSSGQVVDSSSLARLMLTSPVSLVDDFSYSILPDLQQEIHAWRVCQSQ